MARTFNKGALSQQRRPSADILGIVGAMAGAGFKALYDITQPGGAFSIADVEAFRDGDPIHRIAQLFPDSPADDITLLNISSEPAELYFRRDLLTSTNIRYPRRPMMFYSDAQLAQLENEDDSVLSLPSGNLNLPGGTIVTEYTMGITGAKMLHLMNADPATIAQLDSTGAVGFPVPNEPGTLIIRQYLTDLVNPSVPVTQVFVNGIAVPVGATAGSDLVDPAIGFDLSESLLYFGLPCWATQKLVILTRAIDIPEVATLHQVMNESVEVYT